MKQEEDQNFLPCAPGIFLPYVLTLKQFSLSFTFEFYLLHSLAFQQLFRRRPIVYRRKPYVGAEFAGVILEKKVLSQNE